jgi:delta-aminolevulinic acid dehydratase/porphobilinogen synthase
MSRFNCGEGSYLTTTSPKIRDVNEGADIIMVKPALPYLDVLADAQQVAPHHPLACFQVSGEFAMIVAGGRAGVYELKAMAFESMDSMIRAGAFGSPSGKPWLRVLIVWSFP